MTQTTITNNTQNFQRHHEGKNKKATFYIQKKRALVSPALLTVDLKAAQIAVRKPTAIAKAAS
jgi:hypothetical protein